MTTPALRDRERRMYLYNKRNGKFYRGDDVFDRDITSNEEFIKPFEVRIWSTGKCDIFGNDVLEKDIVQFKRGEEIRLGTVLYFNGVTMIETNDVDTDNKITVNFDSVKDVRVMGNQVKYEADEPLKSLTELCWSGESKATASIEAAATTDESPTYDNVDHPKHYKKGAIDVVGYVASHFSVAMNQGAYVFNIVKYVTRYLEKNGLEDLKKAKYYLDKLIHSVEQDGLHK